MSSSLVLFSEAIMMWRFAAVVLCIPSFIGTSTLIDYRKMPRNRGCHYDARSKQTRCKHQDGSVWRSSSSTSPSAHDPPPHYRASTTFQDDNINCTMTNCAGVNFLVSAIRSDLEPWSAAMHEQRCTQSVLLWSEMTSLMISM